LSGRFARAAAEEIAGSGIPVCLAESFTTTPAISFAVRQRGAAGAVVITASHNPWQWNGVKFKASYGGSAAPEIMRKIEAELPCAADPIPAGSAPGAIETVDLVGPYVEELERIVDFGKIAVRDFFLVADPLFGAARQCLARLFERNGIRHQELHGEANPLFGGLHPEPIEPHIQELRQAVLASDADAGFATDGDADRVGAIDRTGAFIDSHQIFSILLRYLVEVRGMTGGVAKTFSTTKLVDKLAQKYGLPLYETPIGFKYIVEHMLSPMHPKGILIGGEESGGIGIPALGGPERDGVLNAALLAQAMAHYGKSLGELVAELHEEFGPHHYGRVDLALRPGQKELAIQAVSGSGLDKFVGYRVTARENLDGIKLYFDNGAWLLIRGSGTEPLLRVYTEAGSPELVQEILAGAERFIREL
jgi:phosphomannomutase